MVMVGGGQELRGTGAGVTSRHEHNHTFRPTVQAIESKEHGRDRVQMSDMTLAHNLRSLEVVQVQDIIRAVQVVMSFC